MDKGWQSIVQAIELNLVYELVMSDAMHVRSSSPMPRLLDVGYRVGQFCDDTAIQLLPVVYDQKLEPVRRAIGPPDGSTLNDKRATLVGQLQMKLDVKTRI